MCLLGFWRAYPRLQAEGIGFQSMANPQWFETDAGLAWCRFVYIILRLLMQRFRGFYGHRLNLYKKTVPHEGFFVAHYCFDLITY